VTPPSQPEDARSLLCRLSRSPDLAPFARLVEPLVAYDRERRSDLVRTLAAYFDAGANASEAADRLFLHRNSLLYRLERIRELTGLDSKRPEDRLALQLGLLALDNAKEGASDEAQHP
jgi:DNA-binding PucR family transcriptional regulator